MGVVLPRQMHQKIMEKHLTWQEKSLIETQLMGMAITINSILKQLDSMALVEVKPRYPLPAEDLDTSECIIPAPSR
ncbi:hypothetical protein [Fluviicola sp.]|uniref:hypothetical protein n=1 Tax=Fluviicola sp. TaxID=1917219 RepID=UPI00262B0D9C|nr:hypothetical protein [Fluviicola sp.]